MRAVVLLTSALFLFACSNAGLQPIDEQQANLVDDRLDLEGQVCTSPPKTQIFPVKVMFIVDTSGSMQFTDPADATANGCMATCTENALPNCAGLCAGAENAGRLAAVQKVVDRFENNPAVSFSFVRFNSRITINGGSTGDDKFTKDPAVVSQSVSGLATADVLTDYQGALSSALQVLERDMVETDPVTRARTKYVIIHFSDGSPNPLCTPGCGNDTQQVAGVIVDSWCDLPNEQWCSRPVTGDPTTRIVLTGEDCANLRESFPAMVEPCQSYNSNDDIIKKVREIMELGEQYSVGEIRMHTAFLWIDGLPQVVQDLFGLDKEASETLLEAMAEEGNGLYRSFNSGQEIDFLDINYSSVARPFGMTNFFVTNSHALPDINKLLVDSDGDGIDDTTEFENQIKADTVDSDGDGYNDKLEYDRRNSGFDPADSAVPVRQCPMSEREDRDGDGLLDCEEYVLGTDPTLADTDRDRMPDGIEFWFDTKPLQIDGKNDVDLDRKRSEDEIKGHSDPLTADPEIHSDYRYIYDMEEQPERVDRRRCYKFTVRRVRLVTTAQQGKAGTLGYNEIMAYFGEGPVDDPQAFGTFQGACVRAQYVNQSCQIDGIEDATCGFKNPANGKIVLTTEDFYDLTELRRRKLMAQTDPSQDPCVGVALP